MCCGVVGMGFEERRVLWGVLAGLERLLHRGVCRCPAILGINQSITYSFPTCSLPAKLTIW